MKLWLICRFFMVGLGAFLLWKADQFLQAPSLHGVPSENGPATQVHGMVKNPEFQQAITKVVLSQREAVLADVREIHAEPELTQEVRKQLNLELRAEEMYKLDEDALEFVQDPPAVVPARVLDPPPDKDRSLF